MSNDEVIINSQFDRMYKYNFQIFSFSNYVTHTEKTQYIKIQNISIHTQVKKKTSETQCNVVCIG